jgi:hypothetical protein
MFEHYSKPVIPWEQFVGRVIRYAGFSFLLILFSLVLGALGYHFLNDLSWTDAVLNASMILTGMGPVDVMKTDVAKWFASAYALYSGIAFLSTTAIFLTPIVHRFLHKFHLEGKK